MTMVLEDFEQFRHRAVHALEQLNSNCEEQFRIGHWERWDYDLDSGTLVFSESGAPKVIAQIQAAGTTSKTSRTWLWGLGQREPAIMRNGAPASSTRLRRRRGTAQANRTKTSRLRVSWLGADGDHGPNNRREGSIPMSGRERLLLPRIHRPEAC
jgi:uncharacterized protein DUF6882